MKEVLFGRDYEGIQSVKITKDGIIAAEEPDANVGSFLYNSKWTANLRLAGMDFMERKASDTLEPAGSNVSTYTKRTFPGSNNRADVWLRNAHFPALAYDLPLAEIKYKDPSSGRFIGVRFNEALHHYDNRGGSWETVPKWEGWAKDYVAFQTTLAYGTTTIIDYGSTPVGQPGPQSLVVWNLPGDESPILDGAPQPPIDGAPVIQIDKDGARVAKPGFDLGNITRPSQLALDTANSPTKIIGAADIVCPAGASSYDLGVAIPANAVADVFAYQGSTITFPATPISVFSDTVNQFGVEYSFDGSLIRFVNPYAACRVRFMVYALGTDAPTAGDNDVLRQVEIGGQNVVQILRPGAGPSPNFSDIVIDSRWPCIQILKEGYIPVDNGQLTHAVDFNGTGCFPIVKWMTVHGPRSGGLWSKAVKPPRINVCGTYKTGWRAFVGGDTTYCELTANRATFYTFKGAPVELWFANFADFQQDRVSASYDPAPIVGIRYYILGIPA